MIAKIHSTKMTSESEVLKTFCRWQHIAYTAKINDIPLKESNGKSIVCVEFDNKMFCSFHDFYKHFMNSGLNQV